MKTVTIDLSTIPNAAAIERLPQADVDDSSFQNWAIHEIAAASALVVERHSENGLLFQLCSFSRASMSEGRIVREIERICGGDVRTLFTFNGRGFDLPLLQLRAVANWVDTPNIQKIASERLHDGASHRDLQDALTAHGAAPRPRLSEVCAALNVPSKRDRNVEEETYVFEDRWDRNAWACEIDVISTWLVNLHLEAHQLIDFHRVQDDWSADSEVIPAAVPI